MSGNRIIALENDRLNMACDEGFLYVRRFRDVLKYDKHSFELAASATVFKKDGASRGITLCGGYIFLFDFIDLYILDKNDLRVVKAIPMGCDASSDVIGVVCAGSKAYVDVRNGRIAVFDLETLEYRQRRVCESSFWTFCAHEDKLYIGTVNGELIEASADGLAVCRSINLCKKNIYGIVPDGDMLCTVSQDTTLKAVSLPSFEVVCEAKNAVRGMVRLIGKYEDKLVVADRRISLFDAKTLALCERFDFPAGWNSGVFLDGDTVYGSARDGIYALKLARPC